MVLPLSGVLWPRAPGFEGMKRDKSSGQDRWSHQDGWNQGGKTAVLNALRVSHWEMKQAVSAPGKTMWGGQERRSSMLLVFIQDQNIYCDESGTRSTQTEIPF